MRIQHEFPAAAEYLASWIRISAEGRDWRRVERLANLAAALRAPNLSAVLVGLLEADISGLNEEDLVDILGEIRAVESAGAIFRIIKRRLDVDAPAYWLCQKAILSLSELDTDEAERYLRSMLSDWWPKPVRWHAAVVLCVEDDLGFDEGSMLT
ncbi:hypothetical protein ABT336_06385 [Micromonospora sp. NPDC000207]|uniref:hypothetical protein n=1 Tax=Micromonospora sp. NPDC000207 TaxID=3154246 RepID=UPI00332F26AE